MNILGVSCYHHDSAAAHLKDNKIVAASQEERFSRVKYDSRFPINTLKWLKDVYSSYDEVAFYDKQYFSQFKEDIKAFTKCKPVLVDHHEAHAMSSIITTNWDTCSVIVVDTQGGKFSTSLGVFEAGKITWIKRFRYPNSLGLFYSTATRLLGLTPLQDEAQVMAASLYGKPKWSNLIKDKILNTSYGDYTVIPDLNRGLGYGSLDWDIASSVQAVLEEALVNLTQWLIDETGLTNVAYAGGVALNCVANSAILKRTSCTHLAIQPAAGDAGCALGAAALIERPLWRSAYLGVHSEPNIDVEECASMLLKGDVVPVIQGRAEFGPRALGNRSILSIPFDANNEKLNIIKGRVTDSWRPYAPVCQETDVSTFFAVPQLSYDMLFTGDIIGGNFQNATNTARLQVTNPSKNPYLNRVIQLTKGKGYPILINTSLNAKGKPIVNTIEDLKNEISIRN